MDGRWILALVVAIVAIWALVLGLLWLLRPRGVRARDVLRVLPDLLRLVRSIIGDRSTPVDVRLVLVGAIAWIASPIDLIPEFIPVIGPLDDVVVAILAIRYAARRLGRDELRRRWTGTDEGFAMIARLLGPGG